MRSRDWGEGRSARSIEGLYPDGGGVGHEEVLRPGRLRRRQVSWVVVRRRPEPQVACRAVGGKLLP